MSLKVGKRPKFKQKYYAYNEARNSVNLALAAPNALTYVSAFVMVRS